MQENLKTKILLADNNIDTRKQLLQLFNEDYCVLEASNGRDVLEKVSRYKVAVIIADINMPIMDGLELSQTLLSKWPHKPIILLNTKQEYIQIKQAMDMGVRFVLPKNELRSNKLVLMVNSLVQELHDKKKKVDYIEYLESEVHAKTTSLLTQLSERRKVDKALKQSELRLRSVIENATEIICTLSPQATILSLNRIFFNLTHWHAASWIGKSIYSLVHKNDEADLDDMITASLQGNLSPIQEARLRTKTGAELICEFIVSPLRDNEQVVGILLIIRDITYRKKVEKEKERLQIELLQAQKLESIGRLAGGVAHDFNNALTAILGFSDLALSELPREHAIREYLDIIKDSGEKAAALTRQLLAFSRKQILKMEYCCLNSIVTRMAKMLQRLIGDDVLLKLEIKAEQSLLLADIAQLEQVIINLLINARDAMPKGGELYVATSNESLTEEDVEKDGLKPGCYVVLNVIDKGIGMSDENCSKIFEPFYTTKAPGEGTGLGLATVFGVLKQHQGFIECISKVNEGSTFKAYLPVTQVPVEKQKTIEQVKPPLMGTEHILVVDDEPAIRRLLVNVLRKSGYQLSQASSGEDALTRYSESINNIDLLITDIVMPGINGKILADKLKRMNEDLKTVYISGYAQQAIDQKFVDEMGNSFLEKPLKMYDVSHKVRQILDTRY